MALSQLLNGDRLKAFRDLVWMCRMSHKFSIG